MGIEIVEVFGKVQGVYPVYTSKGKYENPVAKYEREICRDGIEVRW
jgi:hypothetical protein